MNNPRVDDLEDLVVLSEALIPDSAMNATPEDGARYWEDNRDSSARRIEVLLKCAIDGYDDPDDSAYKPAEVEVAFRWFGLHPDTRQLGQEQRHERAADAAEIKPGTFKSHRSQKIKNALAQRLAKRYKDNRPFALAEVVRSRAPNSAEASMPKEHGAEQPLDGSLPPTRKHHPLRLTKVGSEMIHVASSQRGALALVGFIVVVSLGLGLAAILGFISSAGDSSSIPAHGSVINAITGEVEAHPITRRPAGEVDLVGGGALFRACNLTRDPKCHIRDGTFYAQVGDVMKFVLILDNEAEEPLPYARIGAGFGDIGLRANEVEVNANINWPGSNVLNTTRGAFVVITTNTQPVTVKYVPDSTELLFISTDRLSYLPNGIATTSGIALTDIGHPKTCFFNCTARYLRYLEFKMIVSRSSYPRTGPGKRSVYKYPKS
jgi:hypothetical protein